MFISTGGKMERMGYPSGQDGPILPVRDFPPWSRKKKFPFCPLIKIFVDQACWILPSISFIYFFLASIYLAFVSTIAVLCSVVKHG